MAPLTPSPSAAGAASPGFAQASWLWLRLGLLGFGGPAAQIAMLQREVVDQRGWISQERFLHALHYCLLLPGPEATQLVTYVGWLLHGARGGLVAGGLFLIPSVLLLLLLSSVYLLAGQQGPFSHLFWALQPAVLALVIQACWRLARRSLKGPAAVAIAALTWLGFSGLGLPQPLLIAAAALAGWILERWRPSLLAPAVVSLPSSGADANAVASAAAAQANAAAALEAAASPDAAHAPAPAELPSHQRFDPRRLARTLLAAGLGVGLPLALLARFDGWNGTLVTMARFFSQVALVSFGGAYSVLPVVAKAAVQQYGWLDAAQMVDGLALGETTPGPLILVVVFVGVLGGWHASASLAYALLAGMVVVWFTFLPSFVFILAGAPLVEWTRTQGRLSGVMAAIGAAVVGLVASLALVLARPVLWPQGLGAPPSLAALLLAAAGLLLLLRGWSLLRLLGLAVVVGLGRFLWLGLGAQ